MHARRWGCVPASGCAVIRPSFSLPASTPLARLPVRTRAAWPACRGDVTRLGPGTYSVPDPWHKTGKSRGYKAAPFGSEANRSSEYYAQLF